MTASLIGLAAATATYVPYHLLAPGGPQGGSWGGLTYGICGSALMLFAGLLSLRKRVRVWRVGRAQTWMRGHLWLGLLSFFLILFHGGFALGGALTTVLMVLFTIVILSGLVGAALQHLLPQLMTAQVPMETIYEEIDNVRKQLYQEADELVSSVSGPLEGSASEPSARPKAKETAINLEEVDEAARARLRDYYMRQIRPFLEKPNRVDHPLSRKPTSEDFFENLQTLLPVTLHPITDALEDIAEEERQLNRQLRLHHWLYGWLLVHVPLSFALLVLAAVHAVVALRY